MEAMEELEVIEKIIKDTIKAHKNDEPEASDKGTCKYYLTSSIENMMLEMYMRGKRDEKIINNKTKTENYEQGI